MLKIQTPDTVEESAAGSNDSPPSGLRVSVATLADLPGMLALLREVAEANGESELFDEDHAREHLTEKICKGVCFKLEKGAELIGVVTTARVDLGYRYCGSLETSHTYIRKRDRSLRTFRFLLDALKEYANANNLAIFFHQLAFLQAIRREATNSEQVACLYTYMKLMEVGGSYVVRPYEKIGYTFLHEPGAEVPTTRRVRLRNVSYAPGAEPGPDTEDGGNGNAA